MAIGGMCTGKKQRWGKTVVLPSATTLACQLTLLVVLQELYLEGIPSLTDEPLFSLLKRSVVSRIALLSSLRVLRLSNSAGDVSFARPTAHMKAGHVPHSS
jgi:hypothetical protein